MDVLNKITEHIFDSSLNLLEVIETISNGLETHKIGKIVRMKNQLLCIPDTPLRFHMSVHDTDENHLMARVHHRVPNGKSVFQIYPPGTVIGNTIGQVDIPPFSQITDAICLPPEPPGVKIGPIVVDVQTLWQQSTIITARPNKSRRAINIDTNIANVNGIGMQYFFVELGNLTSLIKWFSVRKHMFAGVELTAEVFEVFVPWLAVVTYKGNLFASKPTA